MRKIWIGLIALSFGLSACSWLFPEEGREEEASQQDLPTIPYDVVISGDLTDDLESYLKESSLLVKLEKRPPTNDQVLLSRIKEDLDRLKRALHAKGYFDGEISYEILTQDEKTRVVLKVVARDRYRIKGIEIKLVGADSTYGKITPDTLAPYLTTQVGSLVDLEQLAEDSDRIAKYLRNHGFPFVKNQETQAVLDTERKEVVIYLRFKAGIRATYGPLKIQKTGGISEDFIKNRILWTSGEVYDEREVEATRLELMQTGIFSSVVAKPTGDKQSAEVPMDAILLEGPPRTIGAGLKYSSSEGASGKAFWKHVNLRGGGEAIDISVRGSKPYSKADITYDIPDVFAPREKLSNSVFAIQDRGRSYISRTVGAGSVLHHRLSSKLTGTLGLKFEVGHVKRDSRLYRERLWGIPMGLKLDTTDNLIDPTKGLRLYGDATAYMGQSGEFRRVFVPAIIGGSTYWRSDKHASYLVGIWGKVGSIFNAKIEEIVPNKRIYAGGAGSIRGYGYQMVGPLDSQYGPRGGRSLLEVGLEGRVKVTDTIGFVAFVEGGSVTVNPAPSFRNEDRLWGAGIGGRYYTSIGPIRLDIAVPLKVRRDPGGKKIDAPYQFYISIGQAF